MSFYVTAILYSGLFATTVGTAVVLGSGIRAIVAGVVFIAMALTMFIIDLSCLT